LNPHHEPLSVFQNIDPVSYDLELVIDEPVGPNTIPLPLAILKLPVTFNEPVIVWLPENMFDPVVEYDPDTKVYELERAYKLALNDADANVYELDRSYRLALNEAEAIVYELDNIAILALNELLTVIILALNEADAIRYELDNAAILALNDAVAEAN
jgi:hypothetical protein